MLLYLNCCCDVLWDRRPKGTVWSDQCKSLCLLHIAVVCRDILNNWIIKRIFYSTASRLFYCWGCVDQSTFYPGLDWAGLTAITRFTSHNYTGLSRESNQRNKPFFFTTLLSDYSTTFKMSFLRNRLWKPTLTVSTAVLNSGLGPFGILPPVLLPRSPAQYGMNYNKLQWITVNYSELQCPTCCFTVFSLHSHPGRIFLL